VRLPSGRRYPRTQRAGGDVVIGESAGVTGLEPLPVVAGVPGCAEAYPAAPGRVRWWHWHRWPMWEPPYQTGGLSTLWNGAGLPRQRRACTGCGLVQDRSCVLDGPKVRPVRERPAVAGPRVFWWVRLGRWWRERSPASQRGDGATGPAPAGDDATGAGV
jgi:hypothetical protein